MILKKLCFSNKYEHHSNPTLCLSTRQFYITMHHSNGNTTNYLVRFSNELKVNKEFNGSLITIGFQEHGMNMVYPIYVTSFYALQDNIKKQAEIAGEKMLSTIFYLENIDKIRFSDIKKRVGNDYILKQYDYPRIVTELQIPLLDYQHNYNSNIKSQSQGVVNQLMLAQCRNLEIMMVKQNTINKTPQINIDHITFNDFGEKVHYAVNRKSYKHTKSKEDAESFRKMK